MSMILMTCLLMQVTVSAKTWNIVMYATNYYNQQGIRNEQKLLLWLASKFTLHGKQWYILYAYIHYRDNTSH